MKSLILVIVMSVLSFGVQASILESQYASRHLAKIEKAIASECFLSGVFTQVDSVVEEIRVDQGITDYNYQTTFKHVQRIDQGVFDDYLVEVTSHYADMYDHSDRDWGYYSVSKVTCTLL